MEKELEILLEELVNSSTFPGCNYCIVTKSNKYSGSVGYKSLIPRKVKNKENNIYDIASLSKLLVTNTLISFLVRDKKLDLEDLVIKYIQEFPFDDIKIYHLLTHSSGIVPTFDKFNIKSKDEFIHSIKRLFSPGSDCLYIDVNFILLGFIIEKVYGESLDTLARTLIFEPLDMKDTSYNPKMSSRIVPTELTTSRGLVKGKVHDEKADYLGGVAGHAGVFSTVNDMSHFIEMILHDGFYNGKEFLEKTYIDLWFSPLFIDKEGVRRTIGWVYAPSGKSCKDICGNDSIFHTGFPGCYMLIDRDNDLGIIFMSNRIHPTRENTKFYDRIRDINELIYKLIDKYE